MEVPETHSRLCLRRKKDESIVVGEIGSGNEIIVTIYEVRNKCVRVSVIAPVGVKVLRSELIISDRAALSERDERLMAAGGDPESYLAFEADDDNLHGV